MLCRPSSLGSAPVDLIIAMSVGGGDRHSVGSHSLIRELRAVGRRDILIFYRRLTLADIERFARHGHGTYTRRHDVGQLFVVSRSRILLLDVEVLHVREGVGECVVGGGKGGGVGRVAHNAGVIVRTGVGESRSRCNQVLAMLGGGGNNRLCPRN